MHLIVILAVVLLLFGAAKLPALAKSMGQSARVFKDEMSTMKEEDAARAEKKASDPDDSGSTGPAKDAAPDSNSTN